LYGHRIVSTNRREITMIRLPKPATCIATVALLLAVTGTATAAGLITGAQIKDNTVGSPDLRNNGVATQDVRNNSLTSLDVADGSLKAVDFAAGELATGPAGPAGPAGTVGPAGPAGPQGAPGVSGLEIVTVSSVSNSTVGKAIEASCPAGKKLLGGGAQLFGAPGSLALDESFPNGAATWRATAYEVAPTASNWTVTAYAICATVA
jgi:hypothetical protein